MVGCVALERRGVPGNRYSRFPLYHVPCLSVSLQATLLCCGLLYVCGERLAGTRDAGALRTATNARSALALLCASPTSSCPHLPSAHPRQPKSIFDKDVPPEEMIQGLLKMMPVGARTVTILPPEAVEEMAKEGKPRPAVRASLWSMSRVRKLLLKSCAGNRHAGSEWRVGPHGGGIYSHSRMPS